MGDHHHRTTKITDQPLQPDDSVQIEVVGGLVEQQQIRLGHQRPRQRNPLDAAAREAADRHFAIQRQTQQHLIDTLAGTPRVGRFNLVLQRLQSGESRRIRLFSHSKHRRVIVHQKVRHRTEALRDGCKNAGVEGKIRFLRHIGDLESRLTPDDTVVKTGLTSQGFEQAGLTRAIASDQRNSLCQIQLEVGLIQQFHMPECKTGVINGKNGHE